MLPASTKQGGVCFAMPDACLTPAPPAPPVPVPYPNTAQLASANGTSTKVMFANKEVVCEGSKVPSSMGDEAGTNGGVMSGVNMKEVQPRLFSSKVFVQGKKAVFLTAMTAHNGPSPNAPVGAIIAPSQTKVFVAP